MGMASATTSTTKKSAARKAAPKRPRRKLSNAQLLKLAARSRPPQSWFDDTTDPTRPEKR
jgi:hypothetical protein